MRGVSVVIVNYKSSDVLGKCLDSLAASKTSPVQEIVVVDSDSADAGLEAVLRRHPSVRFIQAGRNAGFAYSCNLGIRDSSGDAVLLLNPDTEVDPDAVRTLYDTLQRFEQVGLAGPKVLNTDGSLQTKMRPKKMHGVWHLFCELFYLDKALPFLPLFNSYYGFRFDHDKEQPVELLCGCCLMVKRSLIDKIGLLDEGFFLYYEDSDWCKRAKNAGLSAFYVPKAVVRHYHGRSTESAPQAAVGHFYGSQLRFMRKHRGRAAATALYVVNGIGLAFRQLAAPVYLLKDGRSDKVKRHFWALKYHANLKNLWKLLK